jgi:hypothetical protein
MEEDFENYNSPRQSKAKGKIKGVSDFLLIIRDRWLLSLALSLPVALGYVFVQQQVHEYFESSSSFSLIPPPAILNLRSVDRDQHVEGLIAKHTEGLNSQQLRTNVILRIKNSPEYKSILLAPFLKDGIIVDLSTTVSYTVAQVGAKPPTFHNHFQFKKCKGGNAHCRSCAKGVCEATQKH